MDYVGDHLVITSFLAAETATEESEGQPKMTSSSQLVPKINGRHCVCCTGRKNAR